MLTSEVVQLLGDVLVAAVDDAIRGKRTLRGGMSCYQRVRDVEAKPFHDFSDGFAQLQPPPPELKQLIGAMQRQPGSDGRDRQRPGEHPPAPEFFAPENVGKIVSHAG